MKVGYRERRSKHNPSWQREAHYQTKYGITIAEYDRMYAAQGGRCAICNTTEPGGHSRFCVDHSHDTGAIRALLCNHCNMSLGLMDDSPERLEAAARYIRAFGDGVFNGTK